MAWQRALVTGASSGIGDRIARRLAQQGTSVVVVARDTERLERLAEELAPQAEVEVLAADLADPEQLASVEQRLASTDSPIDLLVNNAGFSIAGTLAELHRDDAARIAAVNALAPLRLAHAALGAMLPRRRGAILTISSGLAYLPGPGSATYSASKAFVTSLTQALAIELKGSGVTATAVHPGLTHTEFQERANSSVPTVPELFWQTADQVAAEALEAAASGKVVVSTGFHNKAVVATSRLIPQRFLRAAAGFTLSKR